LNGKLDLAQAEAVDALIRADSLGEAINAMAALSGRPSRAVAAIIAGLEERLAVLEAEIEFAEEQGLGLEGGPGAVWLTGLERQLEGMSREFRQSKLLREGVRVTLTGRANVGKSSIFNRLLRKKRAIVTAAPGTTRDVLEGAYEAGPVRVRLFDTAGLATPRSEAEREGLGRSRLARARAELLLVVVDASRRFSRQDRDLCRGADVVRGLVLLNKVDLAPAASHRRQLEKLGLTNVLEVSARTGRGFRRLELVLAERAEEVWQQSAGRGGFMVTLRQRKLFDAARKELAAARQGLETGQGDELVAHHLRRSLEILDGFSGRTLPDRLLRRVFDRFCVGK
jgi:tRNA modification GTPase